MPLIALTIERPTHNGREQMNFAQTEQYCVAGFPHQAQTLASVTGIFSDSACPFADPFPKCVEVLPQSARRDAITGNLAVGTFPLTP